MTKEKRLKSSMLTLSNVLKKRKKKEDKFKSKDRVIGVKIINYFF